MPIQSSQLSGRPTRSLGALAVQSKRAPVQTNETIEFAPNRILVAFHPWVRPYEKRVVLTQASPNLLLEEPSPSPFFDRIYVTAGLTVSEAIDTLKKDPRLRVAEPDYLVHAYDKVPNDPNFTKLWGLRNTGQGPNGGTCTTCSKQGADISAVKAWDLTTGSSQVVVAVIDTGVDYNHPDLTANILRDSSNKVVGYDYFNKDDDPMDDYGHGTHCAGTIGGTGNNGIGVAGVNWNVKIMPLKFMGSGGWGYTSEATLCVDFAVTHGAHVMSNSWGGGGFDQLFLEALQRAEKAGILFVAAAGNAASNIDAGGFFPASYNQYVSNVVSVAATDCWDELAYFSNYGPQTCDIAAPGDTIYSTVPTGSCPLCNSSGYTWMSGTSMATPHVAGAAALIKARFPDASLTALKSRLLYSVDHPSDVEGYTRSGRLNVFAAMQSDAIAPGGPVNFSINQASGTGLRLTWTASGENQLVGTVSAYQLFYNTTPDMTTANMLEPKIKAGPPGTLETFDLTGLEPQTVYYVGLRAVDKVGNTSPLVLAPAVMTNSVFFFDGAESTPSFSAIGSSTWRATTEAAHSGSHSYSEATATRPYYSSQLEMTSPISVTGPSYVKFWAKTDLDNSDGFYFYLYETDASYYYYYVGKGVSSWNQYQIDLSGCVGHPIKMGFLISRGSSASTPPTHRVWIDDISFVKLVKTWEDNVEGVPQFTGLPPWSITTEQSSSPTHAWSDSPYGNYGNNAQLPLMQNASVTPSSNMGSLALSFKAKTDLENNKDWLEIYVTGDDGANWNYLGALTGTSSWSLYTVSLPGFKKVRSMFFLTTNAAQTRDGVYLDDIGIWGEPFTRARIVASKWDLNGDLQADILWRNTSTGEISAWLMNGTTHLSTISIGTYADPNSIIVGVADFNRDGKADLLRRNVTTGEVSILFMNGITYSSSALLGIVDPAWKIVGVADFNGDAKPDILWRNTVNGANCVWLMDGVTKNSVASLDSVSNLSWSIVGVADFNSDGKPDILWRNLTTGELSVWFMNGISHSDSISLGVVDLAWETVGADDFNGDGKPDILWRNAANGSNCVWVMDGIIYASLASLESLSDLNWKIVGVEDFNGDGKHDILWRNSVSGELSVWFMNGVTHSDSSSIVVGDPGWNIVGIDDFNSDGKNDLLRRNLATGELSVWFMNGTNYSSNSSFGIVDLAWKVVGVADFNGDGKPDILWRNATTGGMCIWYMDGIIRTSYAYFDLVPDLSWNCVGIGDFNGDGKPDILWRNPVTGELSIWYMSGISYGGRSSVGIADPVWKAVGVADFNGDGKPDILWRNTANGSNCVWFMDGITRINYTFLDAVTDQNWQIVPQSN